MLESLPAEDNAIILEFKVRNPKKEDSLSDTVQKALEQIRKYGFAFEGKTVLIG